MVGKNISWELSVFSHLQPSSWFWVTLNEEMFSQGLIRDLINIKSLRTFLLTRDIKKYINSNTALIFRNAFLCRKILSKSLLSPLLSFCCILSTYFGEGNGNPLQCSFLENPRDRGAWWAAVYGVHRVGHDWSNLAAAAAAAAAAAEHKWIISICVVVLKVLA